MKSILLKTCCAKFRKKKFVIEYVCDVSPILQYFCQENIIGTNLYIDKKQYNKKLKSLIRLGEISGYFDKQTIMRLYSVPYLWPKRVSFKTKVKLYSIFDSEKHYLMEKLKI